MCLKVTVVFISLCFISKSVSEISKLKLGFLYPFSGKDDISMFLPFASAFNVALDSINNNTDILPSVKLEFIWNNTEYRETVALKAMSEQWVGGVDAFFGPGNESYCATAARMATSWNLPIISYLCAEDIISNKTLYPTSARTRPPNAQLSKSILAVLRHFRWNRVAILYCQPTLCGDGTWVRAREDIKRLFRTQGVVVAYEEALPQGHEQDRIDTILEEIKKKARVVIIASKIDVIPPLMAAAFKKNMTDGRYVYVITELNYDDLAMMSRDQWWTGMMGRDADLTEKAYHSVLALVPRPFNVSKYARFEERVIDRLSEYSFYNNTDIRIVRVLHYAAYLYDAVYLYGLAANRTIAKGLDPRNGMALAREMRGISYESITGFEVRVDANGEAEFNMTLLDLQKNANGDSEMLTVGDLWLDANGSQTLRLIPNMEITWSHHPGPHPVPADSPACGFSRELCPTLSPPKSQEENSTMLIVLVTVCSTLVFTLSMLISLHYRKRKFEVELTSQLWKVNYNEIAFNNPMWHYGSRTRSSMATLSCFNYQTHQSSLPHVGIYKGSTIIITKIDRHQIDLTRAVLLELKQMRDLQHMNLARFVGACVDGSNPLCILMEYYSRGSLHDIIEDDNIKLDPIFIYSFITDIVQGMEYLHSTEVIFHGNLQSSNCVLDSRWVLKITDFGLRSLRASAQHTQRISKELLWSAPEVLRHEVQGSQKADVYSFAIILQELETRTEPYYEYCLDITEIIARVKVCEDPPFRPRLSPTALYPDLRQLMTSCWDECPEERMDFRDIKRLIRNHHGRKQNMVEKIIHMLEEYSADLEELVRERTAQWIDEKKKTEELLHSMLPKSVADQLIAGLSVEAENFDEVSIFFSDIIGFTALCAESSPLQVVTLLNDLYTLFDEVISNHDVYKVETIGDAYMVVSGLPLRNGHEHVRHIAEMALDLLQAQHTFVIRHRPNEALNLRIGIHSGPVCAGVVGMRMPRYCLFGDTVNTAARMEANGEALKIHISEASKTCLDRFDGYLISQRGKVFLKGKGHVTTYWLHGRKRASLDDTTDGYSPPPRRDRKITAPVGNGRITFDDVTTYPDSA